MQYAISISYKYTISELCILPYPFGLHRLPSPAPPEPQHWTRERLDTLRQHRSGRSASPRSGTRTKGHGDSTRGRAAPEIKASSGTPEEPEPARRQQRRQDRQQTTSPARAAEIEPEPESQKRGTVDHERTRKQVERELRKEERERRKNDSKTPLFSPSHRTPSRSAARASPAPTDTDNSRNAAFFGSAFVEYAESTEINAYFVICIGGGGFTFSRPHQRQKFGFVPSSPRLYLFHRTIISQTHRSSTIYFLTNINILCYRLLFGRMP